MTERRLPKTAVENLVEDLENKANPALTNSPYTTNRILEIPQDIKLELNNGALTLKAGSKVYVPNGVGVFDAVTVPNDVKIENKSFSSGTLAIFSSGNGNSIAAVYKDFCTSGTTAPTDLNYRAWYDTTNNLVKSYSNGAYIGNMSFPLAICSYVKGTGFTSIDQVFNGFGYIGGTIFALPGVKVQTPNGKNEDGTYKSVIRTIDSVRTYDAGAWGTRNLNIQLSGSFTNAYFEAQAVERFTYNKKFSSDATTYSYDENTGMWWYSPDQSSWAKSALNIVGYVTVTSGIVTSFSVFSVDSVANSNLSNLPAAGQAKFDAKANVSLNNLDATGQAKFDAKADVSLSNLDATGQAKFDAKANVSLNNLDAAGQAIINGKADINASNFTATGKQNIIGWAMPNYSAGVNMGAGITHTATRKGWVMFKTSTSPGNGVIQINGIEFSRSSAGAYGTAYDTVQEFVPVDVGNTFFITNNATAVCIFYPCKGA